MKKTILTIATILAVAALSLTACGGETSNASPKTENSAKTGNMTAYEFYKAGEEAVNIHYKISGKSKKFLKDHGNLFPCQADDFATEDDGVNVKLIDTDLDAKHFTKNKNEYGDKFMMVPRLRVAQIEENEASNDDGYYTIINATDDDNEQYYSIIYNGRLDMYDGDEFSCIGLPLDNSSFDNTDGGTTLTIVMAGSVIDKFIDSNSYYGDTETYLPDDLSIPQDDDAYRKSITGPAPVPEETSQYRSDIYSSTLTDDDIARIESDLVDPYKEINDAHLKTNPNWPGGIWVSYSDGGANTVYIYYNDDLDRFFASFDGSYYDSSGETDGLLEYYPYATNVWEYSTADSNRFVPCFDLGFKGDTLEVFPDDGYETFGGMDFPGFTGTYTRQ